MREHASGPMDIILVDTNKAIVDAWRRIKTFSDPATLGLGKIDLVHGSIFDVRADAIVSPANSFGFMDGGIDALYTEMLGPQVQAGVQKTIREDYDGELLVGQSFIQWIGSKYSESAPRYKNDLNYLVVAPTMRIPRDIRNTVTAYLAT